MILQDPTFITKPFVSFSKEKRRMVSYISGFWENQTRNPLGLLLLLFYETSTSLETAGSVSLSMANGFSQSSHMSHYRS